MPLLCPGMAVRFMGLRSGRVMVGQDWLRTGFHALG
jgi:hypothetical protein